jgi:hypothetical protein
MNPPLLLSLALATQPPGSIQLLETASGGTLQLGRESFRFSAESLNLAPAQPKLKLPRTFVLRGKLEPAGGTAISFELTALEDGRIYGLRLLRKQGNGLESERWGATLKTKVEVQELDARPGGKLRISLSGPLASNEADKGGATSWKGELWATFREVPLRDAP